ncbi:MAG: iron-containing redox enzyme family protein, partial [Hyphomicrobiales bacterium]
MRTYQNRFVLLPQDNVAGSVVEMLHARYDPRATHALDANRAALEEALIEPIVAKLRPEIAGRDVEDYIDGMLDGIRNGPPSEFLTWLDRQPKGEGYYRNFLIQSSADLLAEASASAMGVIGEFGAPQSALFRILIDEFGYGTHDKKHSVLFRDTMRGFGLNEEYNGYWPIFDTEALNLHNVIHYLFQSPRNLFRQIGFLLYAETSYQVSTGQHFQYLKRRHPEVDD